LERENLFLIHLDDRGEWFRFHHLFQELLQEMLRTHLSADEINALYLRASHWFSGKNLVGDAIHYALFAGDTGFAADMVIRNRYGLMNTEQWHLLERWMMLLSTEIVDLAT